MHKNIFRIFHAKIFACAKIARESASERLLPNSEEWAVILKDSSELCSCQKSAESELFCGILRSTYMIGTEDMRKTITECYGNITDTNKYGYFSE